MLSLGPQDNLCTTPLGVTARTFDTAAPGNDGHQRHLITVDYDEVGRPVREFECTLRGTA